MSSKHRVVVLKIVAGQLTVSAAAEYGLSRQYLHKLLARYRTDDWTDSNHVLGHR